MTLTKKQLKKHKATMEMYGKLIQSVVYLTGVSKEMERCMWRAIAEDAGLSPESTPHINWKTGEVEEK